MAGMFYIMSMYFYLKGRMSGKVPFFVLCFASALLAFGTKENTAMLPVTLFFFDLFLIQGVDRKTIAKNMKIGIIPFFILFGLGMYYMGFSSFMSGYDDRPFTIAERLLTEPRVILLYISLLLYPIDLRLMLLHDIQISHTIFAPWTTLPAILLILLIVCCVLYFSNKKPLVSFCVLFFFLNHLIEGSVLPLELIYEHRNYVPSMLFFVPVAILIVKLVNYLSYRRSIQIVVVFGVALLFVIQGHAVYMRNDTLRSDLVMWKDNVKKAPNLSRPHNNLGDEYFNMGLRLEAFCEFKKALDLNRYSRLQNKAIAEYNIGRFYWLGDMDDKALVHFKKAISISPAYPSPLHGMAMIEMKSGNVEAARDRCMEILKYNPQHIESRELLSLALLKLGELEQSIDESQRALNLNPGKTFSLVVMAEAFRKKGENGKAIMYWKKFMKVNPRNIDVHLALIELYSLTGKNDALTETIDSLMCVKAGRNLEEIICERKDGKILAYLPDRKKILGIIRENLSDRIKSVKS
jgi:tetratricopeptide (TPR) repeat protein